MKNQITTAVKVTANPKTGEIFTLNTNPDGTAKLSKDGRRFGFVRLQSEVIDMSSPVGGVKTISALKSFSEDDFKKAKGFLVEGRELPGKIIRIESLEKQQGFSAKMAGSEENAEACTLGGKQIYQSTQYVTDVNAQDVLIQHDNVIVGSVKAAKAGEALNKQGH